MVELVITHGWPHGWTQRRVAERFQFCPATVSRWVSRARRSEVLTDRSSRPTHVCAPAAGAHPAPHHHTAVYPPVGPTPYRLPSRCRALHHAETSPHRPRHRPAGAHSTTSALRTQPTRRHDPCRHQKARPHPRRRGLARAHGRGSEQDRRTGRARNAQRQDGAPAGRGYSYLHHAVDDYSRMAYSEILTDEKKHTAAGFMWRACAFFSAHGVEVARVMADIPCLLPLPSVQRRPWARLGMLTPSRTARRPTAKKDG